MNCQKAHACCGDERPCKRCVQLGLTDCVDAPRKKRGRKRKDVSMIEKLDFDENFDEAKTSLRKRNKKTIIEFDSQTEESTSEQEGKDEASIAQGEDMEYMPKKPKRMHLRKKPRSDVPEDAMEGLPAFSSIRFDKSIVSAVDAAHEALYEHADEEQKANSFATDYFLSQIKTLTAAIEQKNEEVIFIFF